MSFNFGQWLKTIRTQRNMQLITLGELSGVNHGLLSYIENGRVVDTTLHTVVLVCQALAISDQEFAALAGVPYVEPDTVVSVDVLWEILRPYAVTPRRKKGWADAQPNRHMTPTQRSRARHATLEPESLKLSHARWLATYDDRIFGLLWALAARRIDHPVLPYVPPLRVSAGCDQKVYLADGNADTQRRDLVVPVRVLVDASGVTLQLPCQLAVTLEHYGSQVQVLFWTAEDSGNDPTFRFALDANLAATEPAA